MGPETVVYGGKRDAGPLAVKRCQHHVRRVQGMDEIRRERLFLFPRVRRRLGERLGRDLDALQFRFDGFDGTFAVRLADVKTQGSVPVDKVACKGDLGGGQDKPVLGRRGVT